MNSTLYENIQQFYDESSTLWESIWGEHMHHGYYPSPDERSRDRRQAQIDLIEELLTQTSLHLSQDLNTLTHSILDVGCGIGGSSLYLAEKFDATVTGITLSPVQAQRANERAEAAGLDCNFQVANALEMPFENNSFDLVWSLESGEHMPNKKQFLQECYRVLKPGGTFIFATWCHRNVAPPEPPLTESERRHLANIYRVYYLPYVIALNEYEQIAEAIGFCQIHTEDWSANVAPFWDRVIESALEPQILLELLFSGWKTIQGALALGLMRDGYKRGLVRYGVLYGSK
ncbi:methyltransferase domain-containing protein [Oxynema sp. CENA135]|uniref:methyltransferase domain-containing protein n=1 Tax=Oxynema sp. CENA135 TaxID=984206 RepID=UPI001909868C|nr:methyltransferase domain-containing protein [Oxynema sp. CENA135]MBK4730668.1 methyltransferase domain-containing protein [Oxynema sp. CENA135]